MKGFITVEAEGLEDDKMLKVWIKRGIEYADSLPEK
jgi:hypothetical protein